MGAPSDATVRSSPLSEGAAGIGSPAMSARQLPLGLPLWIHVVLWLWTLYVLSFGPLKWLWYESQFLSGPEESQFWAAFYFPLMVLGYYCPPFANWLDWYARCWGG